MSPGAVDLLPVVALAWSLLSRCSGDWIAISALASESCRHVRWPEAGGLGSCARGVARESYFGLGEVAEQSQGQSMTFQCCVAG